MAKATHAQEVATGTSDSYTPEELADPDPPVVITRAQLGGEKQWTERQDGTDSLESSGKEHGTGEKQSQPLQSPALTTENPSSSAKTEPGSVPTTTTDGTAEEVPPYEEWQYADLQAECKVRELTATGKREELIERLYAWDEEHQEEQ